MQHGTQKHCRSALQPATYWFTVDWSHGTAKLPRRPQTAPQQSSLAYAAYRGSKTSATFAAFTRSEPPVITTWPPVTHLPTQSRSATIGICWCMWTQLRQAAPKSSPALPVRDVEPMLALEARAVGAWIATTLAAPMEKACRHARLMHRDRAPG